MYHYGSMIKPFLRELLPLKYLYGITHKRVKYELTQAEDEFLISMGLLWVALYNLRHYTQLF